MSKASVFDLRLITGRIDAIDSTVRNGLQCFNIVGAWVKRRAIGLSTRLGCTVEEAIVCKILPDVVVVVDFDLDGLDALSVGRQCVVLSGLSVEGAKLLTFYLRCQFTSSRRRGGDSISVVAMEGRPCIPLCRLQMDEKTGQYAEWINYVENRPNRIFAINHMVAFMAHQVYAIKWMMSDEVRVDNCNRILFVDQPGVGKTIPSAMKILQEVEAIIAKEMKMAAKAGVTLEEMQGELYGDDTKSGWLKSCLRRVCVLNICDAGIADRWLSDVKLLSPQFAELVWKCGSGLARLNDDDSSCPSSVLPPKKTYGVYGPRIIVCTYSMLETAFRKFNNGVGGKPWIAKIKLGVVADEVQAFKNMMRFKMTSDDVEYKGKGSKSSKDKIKDDDDVELKKYRHLPRYEWSQAALDAEKRKNAKFGESKDVVVDDREMVKSGLAKGKDVDDREIVKSGLAKGKDVDDREIVKSGLAKGKAIMELKVSWMLAVSGTPITSDKPTEVASIARLLQCGLTNRSLAKVEYPTVAASAALDDLENAIQGKVNGIFKRFSISRGREECFKMACEAGDAMGMLRLAPLKVNIKSYPLAEMGDRQMRMIAKIFNQIEEIKNTPTLHKANKGKGRRMGKFDDVDDVEVPISVTPQRKIMLLAKFKMIDRAGFSSYAVNGGYNPLDVKEIAVAPDGSLAFHDGVAPPSNSNFTRLGPDDDDYLPSAQVLYDDSPLVRCAVNLAVDDIDHGRVNTLANAEVKQLEILYKVLRGPVFLQRGGDVDSGPRLWTMKASEIGYITGGVDVDERKRVIDRLNGRRSRSGLDDDDDDDDDAARSAEELAIWGRNPIKVILLSTMAGGAGLDLSGSESITQTSQLYNPAIKVQTDARILRVTQTGEITQNDIFYTCDLSGDKWKRSVCSSSFVAVSAAAPYFDKEGYLDKRKDGFICSAATAVVKSKVNELAEYLEWYKQLKVAVNEFVQRTLSSTPSEPSTYLSSTSFAPSTYLSSTSFAPSPSSTPSTYLSSTSFASSPYLSFTPFAPFAPAEDEMPTLEPDFSTFSPSKKRKFEQMNSNDE